ncbi:MULTISPECIES: IS110 family RNA-guided transposase [Acidithiobacillus]|uniref:IS110 family transposase n=7 Tax=Acidithiobacillus TaxID=119977 RepID=A0A845U3D5_9PROT|nr:MULTISPECIES: IS110 family transposase [Acidithiobacillus]MBU2817162.1 IS110 family transposase [Acidithiobacillus ferrooxidans]MCR1342782.1 IS110 family transposase [Acidithiobacillus ferrooxidans]NDU41756.1 IS110 family transposase [Acidithiobacillus ferrianus]NDU42841.1 IS110 family transposase [Acidithiobacillus ferrianus]NDU43721.1 IS110 family transposase [Acidithiobacillus ferrianus]
MTHPTLFVGIDVAKTKFDVALLNAEGKYRSKVFPNTPVGHQQFLEWLTRHDAQEAHLCMETTGVYGRDLARFLAQQQILISVVNPAQIHAFGKTELTRAKMDKADARLIARYCRMHRPAPWVPPAEEIATLQALVQRLEDLLALQTMENNRLEAATGPARESVEAVLQFVHQQIEMLRLQIEIHIDKHPDLKNQQELLSSIPGIGDNTAATLLAFLSPLERFHSAKQVVAYAGLNPRIRQSGQWAGKTPIAKAGNALLRKSLYLPAVVAKRHNPIIASFCDRLLARGKRPMQVVVAAMRKLLHLAFGVLKSGKPFNPKLGVA